MEGYGGNNSDVLNNSVFKATNNGMELDYKSEICAKELLRKHPELCQEGQRETTKNLSVLSVFCATFERGTFRSQTLQLAPNCSVLSYWVSLSSVRGISQWLPCSDATTFYSLIDFSFSSIQWTLSPPPDLEIMMNPFRGREGVEEGSCSCWTYNIECVRDGRTIRQEGYVSCRH